MAGQRKSLARMEFGCVVEGRSAREEVEKILAANLDWVELFLIGRSNSEIAETLGWTRAQVRHRLAWLGIAMGASGRKDLLAKLHELRSPRLH